MTQTVITYISGTTYTPPSGSGGPSVVNATDGRAFDGAITAQAQAFFNTTMTDLLAQLTLLPNVDYSAMTQAQKDIVAKIYSDLKVLYNWTQMKTVVSGIQTTIPAVTAKDASGNDVFVPGSTTELLKIVAFQTKPTTQTITSADQITSTMNSGMGAGLEQILRTILASSINNPTTSGTPAIFDINAAATGYGTIGSTTGYLTSSTNLNALANALRDIQFPNGQAISATNPDLYNMSSLIATAVRASTQALLIGDATSGAESLQQVLMVDYVATGNQILYNQMSQLKSAIDINQQVLAYINALQDLMNQKDPQKFVQQLGSLSSPTLPNSDPGSGTQVLSDDKYTQYETSTFTQTLGANPKFTVGGNPDAISLSAAIQTYTGTLSGTPLYTAAFENLSSDSIQPALKYSTQRIINDLNYLKQNVNTQGGSAGSPIISAIDTLLSKLLPVTGQPVLISSFVTDTTGDFQNALNTATTASQSFNDTQREELSRVMFVYEEFYKSATDLLSKIDQIIEKMGSFISR